MNSRTKRKTRARALRPVWQTIGVGACGGLLALAGGAFGGETAPAWGYARPPVGRADVPDYPGGLSTPPVHQRPITGRQRSPQAGVYGSQAAPGFAYVDETPPRRQPARGGAFGMFGRSEPAEGAMVDPFLVGERTRSSTPPPQPNRAADNDPRFATPPGSQLSRLRRFLLQSEPDPESQLIDDPKGDAARYAVPRVVLGDSVIISDFLEDNRLTIPRERVATRNADDSRMTSLEQIVARSHVVKANQGAMVPVQVSEHLLASDVTSWKPVPEPPSDFTDGGVPRSAANPVRPIMVIGEMAGIAPRTAAEILADTELDERQFPSGLSRLPEIEDDAEGDRDDSFSFTLAERAPAPPPTKLAEIGFDETALADRSASGSRIPWSAKLGIGAGVVALFGAFLRRRRRDA
ncbi:MAG: hypothetical protein WD066_08345 [Planctomycetaceae bacterium]